jgi:hypothetical protein
MTSAHSTASVTCCLECGAAVPQGREACQKLFDEVLAREFGDYKYARMHRLTVDVYALQHPVEYMRSAKSYAAHLTGMYTALEMGAAAETNRAVQQWLNGSKVFPRPGNPAPQQRGELTIIHVHEAVGPEDHLCRVHQWALSAWEAWRAYHHLARQWVEQASANRRAV